MIQLKIIHDFYLILIFVICSIILTTILFGLSYYFAVQNFDKQKASPYECGFEPYEDARNLFDVRFYVIAILFMIFDIEAAFIYPWAVSLGHLEPYSFWIMIDFLFELIIGFIYAWRIGALEWE